MIIGIVLGLFCTAVLIKMLFVLVGWVTAVVSVVFNDLRGIVTKDPGRG